MDFPEADEWPGRWAFSIVVIALCWVLSVLSILSWLILPILGFTLLRASRRGAWRPMLLVLLANPLGVYFINGMVDYGKGAPTLHFMGLPNVESYNIEPKTRGFHRTGGCLVRGNEWVSQDFHNLGILALATVFGPPSRSYDGPYPTKADALRLVSSAPVLDVGNLLKGKISIERENLEMDPEQILTIVQDLRFLTLGYEDNPDPSEVNARAALFENRCLILKLLEVDPYPPGAIKSADRNFIILFDRKNMRPFAYYRINGDSATRRPRIQYLPEHSR
jgi:hypothetical protein